MPGTHVHTTVARIYRRSHAGNACYYDCTDIYRRRHAGNACYTTVQLFIVVVMPGTHVHTTVAKIYRRSHAGYACTYDCSKNLSGRNEGRKGGRDPKSCFKFV